MAEAPAAKNLKTDSEWLHNKFEEKEPNSFEKLKEKQKAEVEYAFKEVDPTSFSFDKVDYNILLFQRLGEYYSFHNEGIESDKWFKETITKLALWKLDSDETDMLFFKNYSKALDVERNQLVNETARGRKDNLNRLRIQGNQFETALIDFIYNLQNIDRNLNKGNRRKRDNFNYAISNKYAPAFLNTPYNLGKVFEGFKLVRIKPHSQVEFESISLNQDREKIFESMLQLRKFLYGGSFVEGKEDILGFLPFSSSNFFIEGEKEVVKKRLKKDRDFYLRKHPHFYLRRKNTYAGREGRLTNSIISSSYITSDKRVSRTMVIDGQFVVKGAPYDEGIYTRKLDFYGHSFNDAQDQNEATREAYRALFFEALFANIDGNGFSGPNFVTSISPVNITNYLNGQNHESLVKEVIENEEFKKFLRAKNLGNPDNLSSRELKNAFHLYLGIPTENIFKVNCKDRVALSKFFIGPSNFFNKEIISIFKPTSYENQLIEYFEFADPGLADKLKNEKQNLSDATKISHALKIFDIAYKKLHLDILMAFKEGIKNANVKVKGDEDIEGKEIIIPQEPSLVYDDGRLVPNAEYFAKFFRDNGEFCTVVKRSFVKRSLRTIGILEGAGINLSESTSPKDMVLTGAISDLSMMNVVENDSEPPEYRLLVLDKSDMRYKGIKLSEVDESNLNTLYSDVWLNYFNSIKHVSLILSLGPFFDSYELDGIKNDFFNYFDKSFEYIKQKMPENLDYIKALEKYRRLFPKIIENSLYQSVGVF